MHNLKLLFKRFKPTRLYVVWNAYKVSQHTPLDENSVVGLVDAEERTECSISSLIRTNDIKSVIEAIHCETDIELCHSLYRPYKDLSA